jgi:hypothetical protein
MSFSRVAQCFSMRRDKLWQWIGAFPAFAHVGVIERLDVTDLRQATLPVLHPGM